MTQDTPQGGERPGRLVFEGRRICVHEVDVPVEGDRVRTRELIVHPGAVLIVPMLDEHTVVLIRNERFAVGETLWELPAGTLEPAEPPITCAQRELQEETGYHAHELRPLMNLYTTPGFCDEKMYVFLGQELEEVEQSLDEGEKITVHSKPMSEAIDMIRQGQIRDGKTIAALLYVHTFNPEAR